MKANSAPAFTAFANTIYDTVGLNRLIDDITLIERSLFKDKEGPISTKAKDFTTGAIIPIFEEIEKAGLEPQGDQKQQQFLKDLVKFLNTLPRIKVTIAFDPTQSLIVRLNNQLSTIVGTKVILEMVIDEALIGGAIFEYNGRQSGLTLQEKLDSEIITLVSKAYPITN